MLKEAIKYRCLGEQLLISPLPDSEDMTSGGIVKPQIARLKPNRGIVIAIGEGRMIGTEFMPFTLQPGDKVLYSRYGGTDVEVEGESFILLHWKQIYLVENAEV